MGLKREGMVALSPDRELLGFWCQGCDCLHMVNIVPDCRPAWGWDGDPYKPTLSPSFRSYWPANHDRPEQTRCHLYLRGGIIEFLSDSGAHQVRGFHALQPIPEDYGGVENAAPG